MKLITNCKDTRYVCEAFVEHFKALGYTVDGDVATETHVPNPSEKPSSTAENPTERASEKFACPVCGKEYSKKGSLDKHIAERHAET